METPLITPISPISSNPSNPTNSLGYNLNFKTIFLIVILICACCLLSIGYNFQLNNLFSSGTSLVACIILTLFLFYVLYEFFKDDTCENLTKDGFNKALASAGKASRFFGDQATRGISSLDNFFSKTPITTSV